MSSSPRTSDKNYTDGRDEMNLAEFPISVLQRQQPVDGQGVKLDTVTFTSSRYDPSSRQRQQQRVVLETTSRYGLPTPADENVVLALLHVAKHSHNFTESVVHFVPRQLFQIMSWAPNSRSYVRLRDVLRRLKSLVIRYENSWWDKAGHGYEAEFATGIISEYELARQVSGPRTGKAPPSWVRWTPHFQQSLTNGNLKKLDLEQLFALKLPTAQRMYRFLDKRFYPRHQPPSVEIDLQDFACGHIGLTQVNNVAELKRRLAPAIAELEAIGFIARAEADERYQKVRPGVWRIRFRPGPQFGAVLPREAGQASPVLPAPPVQKVAGPVPVVEKTMPAPEMPAAEDRTIAADFYQRWGTWTNYQVSDNDMQRARVLIQEYGPEKARALIPHLVGVVKRKWPACKSLSGALDKYLPDAVRACEQAERRQQNRHQAKAQQQGEQTEKGHCQEEWRQREACWLALPESQRQEIEQEVLREHPDHKHRPAILKALCLTRLALITGSSQQSAVSTQPPGKAPPGADR